MKMVSKFELDLYCTMLLLNYYSVFLGLGIWGEWLFIFRELGSTGNYFQGFGEQAHSYGDLWSPAKKEIKKSYLKGKAIISFDFFKKNLRLLGVSPPDPPWISKCIYFRANMLIWNGIED